MNRLGSNLDPRTGDVYVLCSDGLSGMVSDDDIRHIVTGLTDIREACRKLIQRANERGGEDNITAVLIKIEEVEDDHAAVDSPDDGKQESGPRHPAANGKTGTSGA